MLQVPKAPIDRIRREVGLDALIPPYVSCVIREKSALEFDDVDELVPVQAFTDFARLLLEIEHGPLLTLDTQVFDHAMVCEEYLKQVNHKTSKYLEAVDACLHFH